MKKLIVTDLDGTILYKSKLSKETIETVQQLRDAGHIFTIATGRHFIAADDIVNALSLNVPYVCCNGAHILTKEDSMHEAFVPVESMKEIHQKCQDYEYIVYTDREIIGTKAAVNQLNGVQNSDSVKRVPLQSLQLITDSIMKVLVIDNDHSKLIRLREQLEPIKNITVVSSHPGYLDISLKGVNKGDAVQKLAELLEIPQEDVITFGDQENDIEMLSFAGMGVAMGNASELLKSNAEYITDSVEDNGFSTFINKNVLNKK